MAVSHHHLNYQELLYTKTYMKHNQSLLQSPCADATTYCIFIYTKTNWQHIQFTWWLSVLWSTNPSICFAGIFMRTNWRHCQLVCLTALHPFKRCECIYLSCIMFQVQKYSIFCWTQLLWRISWFISFIKDWFLGISFLKTQNRLLSKKQNFLCRYISFDYPSFPLSKCQYA
jgi:hypothetical protein